MNRRVELTTEELLLLDGKVSDAVQVEVDGVKKVLAVMERRPELTEEEADLIQKVLAEASGRKLLRWGNTLLTKCDVCGKRAKWGLKKFSGIEMAQRFVSLEGYANLGGCIECMNRLKPIIIEEIDGISCEVDERLSGEKPRWKRYDVRKCKKCGWVGHEGKMWTLPAMMGGKYPGKCPKCGAKSKGFGPVVFESTGKYEVVEVPRAGEETSDE